jgi:hypothetical protein
MPENDIDCTASDRPTTPTGNVAYCLNNIDFGVPAVCGTSIGPDGKPVQSGNWAITQMCGAGANADCNGTRGTYKCVRLPDSLVVEDTKEVARLNQDFQGDCPDGYLLTGNCNSGSASDCTFNGNPGAARGVMHCTKYKDVAAVDPPPSTWDKTGYFWGKDYTTQSPSMAISSICNGGSNASDCGGTFAGTKASEFKIYGTPLCEKGKDTCPMYGTTKLQCREDGSSGMYRCLPPLVEGQNCLLATANTKDLCGDGLVCTKRQKGFQTWQVCTPEKKP